MFEVGIAHADGRTVAANRIAGIADNLFQTNRMAKSVCFLLLGADRSLHEGAALTAAERLQSGPSGLYNMAPSGSDPTPEQSLVHAMSLSAQQIVAGDLHPVPMRILIEGGPNVEAKIKARLSVAVTQDLPEDVDPGVGAAIAVVQQAGPALQGLLRDGCLAQVGLLSAQDRAQLLQRMDGFEQDLGALIEGDDAAGIPAAPNVTIRMTITRLLKSWERLKPVLVASAQGETVEVKDFQKASIFGDLIVKSLDKTVGYYWKL